MSPIALARLGALRLAMQQLPGSDTEHQLAAAEKYYNFLVAKGV